MTPMAKVIPGDKTEPFQRWQVPEIGTLGAGPSGVAPPTGHAGLLTAEQIEEIQDRAYREGYALGLSEGREAGAAQVEAAARRMEGLLGALARPFDELDQAVEEQLVALAITLARHIIRREVKLDRGQILSVVREAMAALPVAAQEVRLHLHPEDASLVRESLSLTENEHGWQIVEDPVLSRGDARISSASSQIDARLETRLNAVIAAMLGGERAGDPPA
jgi:flagellar assembly protein FliH